AKARALGGYFSNLSTDQVTLRVPVAQVDALVGAASDLGLVVSHAYSRTDMSAMLDEQRSRLGARQQVLAQYMAVLKDARAEAVVTVEEQITALISEIEGLEGSIQLLENQTSYGTVTVAFQFQDRAAPARDGSSSFAWLNTMNLSDRLDDFRGG